MANLPVKDAKQPRIAVTNMPITFYLGAAGRIQQVGRGGPSGLSAAPHATLCRATDPASRLSTPCTRPPFMERSTRLSIERRKAGLHAHERWKAFQPDVRIAQEAETNWTALFRDRGLLSLQPNSVSASTNGAIARAFREHRYRTLRVTAERIIGATLDFVDLPLSEQR